MCIRDRGKITETELQIIQIDKDMVSEVSKDLRETNEKIGEFVERKVTAEDQLRRIDIAGGHDGFDAQALQRLEARALELGIVTEAGLVPRYPNPDGRFKVPAAWLIEKAGFHKGMTVGGVGISKKHALALVNRGGATSDLLRLEASIFHRVMDRFGVRLQREPIFVGEEMEDTPKSCAGP